MKKLISFFLLILVMTSCVRYTCLAVQGNGQEFVYRNEEQALVSKKTGVVTIHPISAMVEKKNRQAFFVLFQNAGQANFDISTDDIETDSQAKVVTWEKLKKEFKAENAWAAIATALTVTGDALTTIGGSSPHSNSNMFVSDKVDYSNRYTALHVEGLTRQQRQVRFNEVYLKKTTLHPGEEVSGVVFIDLPKTLKENESFTIQIYAGDETHSFTFKKSRL